MKINFSYNKYHALGERLRKEHISRDTYASLMYEKFRIRQYKDMNELERDLVDYGNTSEQIVEKINL